MKKQGNWLNLKVGDKIKIGKKYAEFGNFRFKTGQIIELIQGEFDDYNGLYNITTCAPSIWNEDQQEFDSIFHLFGNDLEDFLDCKIIRNQKNR
jgi:hypothetical protein